MDWLDQFRQDYANRYSAAPQAEAPQPQQNTGLFGSIGHAIGNATKDVGSFFGDIAHDAEKVGSTALNIGKSVGKGVVDIVPQAISAFDETAKTLRDITLSPIKQHKANGLIDQVSQLNHQWNQKTANWTQADYNDPANKALAQQHFDQINALNDQARQITAGDTIKDRDAKKSAAAAANTVLNIGTLGVGGLAEQGAKLGAKLGVNGAEDIARSLAGKTAAQATEDAITNRTAAGATKTIAGNVAEGAGLGAGYGATNEFGNNGTPDQIWQGALLGAGVGGAFGGAGSFLNKDVRAGARDIPGAINDKLAPPVHAHYDPSASVDQPISQLGGDRPSNDLQKQLEDAWNNNDLPSAQKVIDQLPPELKAPMQSMQDGKVQTASTPLGQATTAAQTATRQLNGEDVQSLTQHPSGEDQAIQSYAAEFKSPEEFITKLAKDAIDREKAEGVNLVPDGESYGYGVKRQSTHADWYRQLYADMGRKPTLQATKDMIETSLKTGKGPGDLIYPGEKEAYQLIADREQGLQHTIQQGAPQELSAQYMDDLAGKPQGTEVAPNPQTTLKLGNAKGKFQEPVLPPNTPNASTDVFPANQRGFFRNVRTSETASPELKTAVGDVKPQTYSDISTNRELVNNAIQQADNDPQAIHDKVTSGNELNDQDIVAGMHLMQRYSQEGKTDQAVRLADSLDQSLRDHGRAVQVASIWNRLTPEGQLVRQTGRVNRVAEKISANRPFGKRLEDAPKIAQEFQDTVEKSGELTEDHVKQAIRDTADNFTSAKPPAGLPAKPGEGQMDIEGNAHVPGATADNLSTGEKVAKNVEKIATPIQKKKADMLVKEITKKVKQEMMTPPAKGEAKSAIDVMREVFGRNKEAQEAFPEAQRILMEKAKDNPRVQEALQKFFDSELGHPAAGSTFNAAIKEQLAKNETKVSEIIMNSWKGQDESIDKVASALVKEGFDEDSAKAIAKEVKDRLTAQVVSAKQRTLQSLAKDAPRRYRKTFIEKVDKLSNLGALDNHDYLDIAKAKLKLPHLTEDVAHQISELSQKAQELPVGFERDQVEHQMMHVIDSSTPKTIGQHIAEILSAPKAMMAAFDVSFTGRQGAVLGAGFPKIAAQTFKKSITYFKSKENFLREMSAMRHDEEYADLKEMGIHLTGIEGGEEAFVSQLPERILGVGKGIQASDRGYTGAATYQRFHVGKQILGELKAAGKWDQMSLSERKDIGKVINTLSGRGTGKQGGLFEKVAPTLNHTLFSPRLWKSRLDILNPAFYYKLSPEARKIALKSAGNFAAIAATVLGMATLAGAKVETDPRSSDFLKVRFGDTRYDILGGFQQNLVFAARELSGEKKNSTTGEVSSLTSGSFGGANRLSILSDLIHNKENPIISAGEDILRGTDAQGNKTNVASTLGGLAVPLNIQDTYTIAKSSNPLQALLMGTIPGTVGAGVNTYPASDSTSINNSKDYSQSLIGQ